MAGHGLSFLLRSCVLLLLVHPLDPSSCPQRNTGTSALLPEELELEMELDDMEPEPVPWVCTALVSWTSLLLVLLITGSILARCLGRKLWRGWREEKRQSRSGRAGPCCPRRLMQLLRHNRAMLRLCLRYLPQQRPRARRAGTAGTCKWKRRFRVSLRR